MLAIARVPCAAAADRVAGAGDKVDPLGLGPLRAPDSRRGLVDHRRWRSELLAAAEAGDAERAQGLLDADADPNAVLTEAGDTMLHVGARKNALDLVRSWWVALGVW